MPEILAGTEAEALARHLDGIRARYPEAQPEWVADVVHAVVAAMGGQASLRDRSLLAEVESLGRVIANAKAEIAALGMEDITDTAIPHAADELDAIIAHTASATEAILESCELLDGLAGRLDADAAAVVQDATTRIYEACSFQDITGQRITKVVATLKAIEQKVAQIVATFGAGERVRRNVVAAGDAALLNGPQLPASAMGQSDIDELLASFE